MQDMPASTQVSYDVELIDSEDGNGARSAPRAQPH